MFAPPTLSSPRGTSAARSSSSPDRGRPLAGPAGIVGSRACGDKPQVRRGGPAASQGMGCSPAPPSARSRTPMTARQQIARLLPLGLLVVLVIAGLRGAVPAPGWNGPLRAYGTPIGIGLEVLCGALLIVVRARARAARRAAERRPYTAEMRDIEPAAALRYTLSY